ncbi:SIMPL domain-containing protein [Nocardia sp. CDC159]|uniref:SIMPL domain-containing protein n=1 Tax=Nocardia pulmonis TaxID=2951408 RepID=A0A9X2IX87_9NOCA|nr:MULTISPECIES: SIMPL domain-containing protein [Nocardia]MCM6774369.1 SIMPL domain-containing protein [Nocardia pulmonis]MCM6787565.1 SIMPL domain-containing protein [Nocardia sp. CDC159]
MTADQHPTTATVTTLGHGTASATPDRMQVTVSVETRASTVASAYNRAGERTAAVTAALRADGVRPADIATSGLSVHTETTWIEGGGSRITGYVASTSLTVSLRTDQDDSDPAAIIGHAVDAGGDDVRLGGLNLTFADQEALLVRARDAAWDNARAKAEQYALRADRKLGPVLEITEHTSAPSPIPHHAGFLAAKAEAAAPVPIEYGESEVSATVRATWQLS